MKTHLTSSVLQRLITVFNHHPQGIITSETCGDSQILISLGLIERCPNDAFRLTEKGELVADELLEILRSYA
jgi:hypothetical protein